MKISLPLTQTPENSTTPILFVKAFLWSILIGISAQVSIPFWPVPMTMQPFSILLLGLMTTPTVSLMATTLYCIEAMFGLPVLESLSSGVHHFYGPTAGYLIGFIPSAVIVSKMKENATTWTMLTIACLAGQTVIYIFGLTWLTKMIGFTNAITYGLEPFLLKIPFTIAFTLFTVKIFSDFTNKTK